MAYYINLYSPVTYEGFSASERTLTGFSINQKSTAERLQPGDKLICYLTKLSRWVGVLDITGDVYMDDSPLFNLEDTRFVVRMGVRPLIWLPKEKAIPIREDIVWNNLTFTRNLPRNSHRWTAYIRGSLRQLDDEDGQFLERLIEERAEGDITYPVDPKEYEKHLTQQIRRQDSTVVSVTVPENNGDENEGERETEDQPVRESYQIQGLLAQIGEQMGMKIWLPKNDRSSVLKVWQPENPGTLLDTLPLNYDLTTIRTIEMIDVLWLKGRAMARAFEVEHTTAVYSGILRMADLMALQPNMDINLHLVAPVERRDKVFAEIQRPVFSLLDRGPLSEYCTFISYDSLRELAELKHLGHLSDSVLEEYAEGVE